MRGKKRTIQLIKRRPLIVAARLLLIIILTGIIVAAGSCLRSKAAEAETKLYSVEEIMLLAAAMQLENGMNGDLCVYLTGTVILNRVDSPAFPNTIKGVLFEAGQYASHTVKNLYTVKVSDRVLSLALRLISHERYDETIIYQSMYPYLGHVKYKIDGEYFATE